MPDDCFVDVVGAVEPAALAGEIAMLAHRRVGEAVVFAVDSLAAQERTLNQLQRCELVASCSIMLDGFESDVLEAVLGHIARIRV